MPVVTIPTICHFCNARSRGSSFCLSMPLNCQCEPLPMGSKSFAVVKKCCSLAGCGAARRPALQRTLVAALLATCWIHNDAASIPYNTLRGERQSHAITEASQADFLVESESEGDKRRAPSQMMMARRDGSRRKSRKPTRLRSCWRFWRNRWWMLTSSTTSTCRRPGPRLPDSRRGVGFARRMRITQYLPSCQPG